MTLKLAALYVTYKHEVKPDPQLKDLPVLVFDNSAKEARLHRRDGAIFFSPGKNLGFAKAINIGASMLGWRMGPMRPSVPPVMPQDGPPDLILVINPDARIIAGSLADAVGWFDHDPQLGAMGPLVLTPDMEVFPSARSFPEITQGLYNRTSLATEFFPGNPKIATYLWPPWSDGKPPPKNKLRPVTRGDSPFPNVPPVPVDWVSGAAMILRRESVEQAGGLDESFFMYAEDIDLCRRMLQKGWTTAFWPGLVVEHEGGGCSKQVPVAALIAHHRSLWTYYRKWIMTGKLEAASVAFGIILRLVMRLLHANPARKTVLFDSELPPQ